VQKVQADDDANSSQPTDAAGFCERGGSLYHEGKYDAALADLNEAIRLDPELANAYMCRGVVFYSQGEFDRSVDDLTESIRLDFECRGSHAWRGAAHYMQGRIDEAISDYSEAIRLDSTQSNEFLNRANAYHRNGQYDEAIADYSEAINLVPDAAKGCVGRGKTHVRLKNYEQALADFDAAIRLDPGCAQAFFFRGRVHHKQNELQQAILDFTEAIRLDPQRAAAYRRRGRAWLALGDLKQATVDFDEARRVDAGDRSPLEAQAESSDDLRKPVKADEESNTADQVDSTESQAMSGRSPLISSLLHSRFKDVSPDSLTITERRFPGRVRADLQRAVDDLFEDTTICHFCGVRAQRSRGGIDFTDLLVPRERDPVLSVPPQYEEVDVGEELPIRCLKEGLWLLEDDGNRFAVFLDPGDGLLERAYGLQGVRFQVATTNDEAGTRLSQNVLGQLERYVQEARSYRGKVLSLEVGQVYTGKSTGIMVHKLREVARDEVVLPQRTLELLDRNIGQFVRQRPRLAERGLATKKGLLFYGPPGAGKTHTIHYLAGSMDDMTTLLISAEQVSLLGEYMTLARLLQPSMVIIEDADLIGRDRSTMESACSESLLNKLLNEMDGLKEDSDILFILTTNRPEALEAALKSRPGRIDQAIEFPLPDEEGRRMLVRQYSGNVLVPDDVAEPIVERTENVSCAFIKELMRRTVQFQLERDDSSDVALADVEGALEELLVHGGSLNRKLLGGQLTGSAESPQRV